MGNYDSNYAIAQEISARLGNEPIPFDSVYSICLLIYQELGGTEQDFDSVYSILLEILPLVDGGISTKVIDDNVITTVKTWSSSKINTELSGKASIDYVDEQIEAVIGASNSDIEGKQTEDFTFVQSLPVSGEEDQLVVIKGDNVDTLYKYVSNEWVEQTPDANILYFDVENEALYSYVTAQHQFAPVSLVNTIVVGSNLNSNADLKALKTPGVYSVVQRLTNKTKGDYIKNWTLYVESVDYEEYDRSDSVYQRLVSNYTIQKRTWSATRASNDGWSSFSTYYAGEIKDTTTSKYYTWSSSKINSEIEAHSGATYTAGQNISIDASNNISADGYVFDETNGSFVTKYLNTDEDESYIATNTASGEGAFAEGYGTTATGMGNHAEGGATQATGSQCAHAEGLMSVASGKQSHAEGRKTIASGEESHTEGDQTVASGRGAHAEGGKFSNTEKTTASGYYAHAEGAGTLASGQCTHAEGISSKATGMNSHAEGLVTLALGACSHAEGGYSEVYVDFGHAEGEGCMVGGTHGHAEGRSSIANGDSAHAEGRQSTASGAQSHAEGYNTTASGEYSHAEGYFTTASYYYAHAEGSSTLATNMGEHAEGNSNLSHKASDTYGNAGNTQHSVGIGEAATKKNAFEIMQNGDMYVLGVGGYQGTDTKVQDASILTLQDVINGKADAYQTATTADIEALFAEPVPPTPGPEPNELWYTTTNGEILLIGAGSGSGSGSGSGFPQILSNVYEDGKGVVTFADDLTEIPTSIFERALTLESIEIPEGVTIIRDYAFRYCWYLTSVTIPNSVTTIGQYAFHNNERLSSVSLPSGLTSIGYAAFEGCESLTSITIPSGVTNIDDATFYGCGLTSVNISNGVTRIGNEAFSRCNLISIDMPESVTYIGDEVFVGCESLTSIIIGSGITYIGYEIFGSQNYVTTFTCKATTPPELYNNYLGVSNNCTIYVPAASVNTYKAAEGWSGHANQIQAIPE